VGDCNQWSSLLIRLQMRRVHWQFTSKVSAGFSIFLCSKLENKEICVGILKAVVIVSNIVQKTYWIILWIFNFEKIGGEEINITQLCRIAIYSLTRFLSWSFSENKQIYLHRTAVWLYYKLQHDGKSHGTISYSV
jgi:hypothetical protein